MIKLFEDFNERNDAIDALCSKYNIWEYTINPDGTVDVQGGVRMYDKGLSMIPIKFGRVSGDFICSMNNLASLENSPTHVGGYFNCSNNHLTTLKGGPIEVGEDFYAANNRLTSLLYSPKYIKNSYHCYGNKISCLKHISIGCYEYKLDYVRLPRVISANKMYINEIITNQDDYGIWRNDGTFNAERFKLLMDDIINGNI